MKKTGPNVFSLVKVLIAVIALTLCCAYLAGRGGGSSSAIVPYSEFVAAVQADRVKSVELDGTRASGAFVNGKKFCTVAPFDAKITDLLLAHRVSLQVKSASGGWLAAMVVSWLPVLFIFLLVYYAARSTGAGRLAKVGKSRARLMDPTRGRVTFADVAGCEEPKEELQELVQFLKEPSRFTALGGKIPKGVLLVGSPGTGKTMLARAVAGEAGVPFFTISGSDFVEMYVGVGASRVRDLFEQAKKEAPCIVFIDEIDGVGKQRNHVAAGGGNDEREQTLNQLLVEMDGFAANEGVIIIGATNRSDVLDPALLRPGRFDRQIYVPLPDVRGREAILAVHALRSPLAPDVSLAAIAKGTSGLSGADLANIVNEAALLSARRGQQVITGQSMEDARDKVVMGVERKSLVISEEERRNTAYHEAGHALVARLLPGSDPVHKVSIIPRGEALGVTMQLPAEDRHCYRSDQLFDRIGVLLGGRAAEQLVFGSVTTGAGNDIMRATQLARNMVCRWGMSDRLGPVFFEAGAEQRRDYSEATAVSIDDEVRSIIEQGSSRVFALIRENRDLLDRIASALMERETISGEELGLLLSAP